MPTASDPNNVKREYKERKNIIVYYKFQWNENCVYWMVFFCCFLVASVCSIEKRIMKLEQKVMKII